MFTFFGSIISSGSPPLFPSKGSRFKLYNITFFAWPLIKKSAVFVAPPVPPDGRPVASRKFLTVLESTVVKEKPKLKGAA